MNEIQEHVLSVRKKYEKEFRDRFGYPLSMFWDRETGFLLTPFITQMLPGYRLDDYRLSGVSMSTSKRYGKGAGPLIMKIYHEGNYVSTMILPAPPPKYVKVEELVVGKEYRIASGLGGAFSIAYQGKKGDLHWFEITDEDWTGAGPYLFTDKRVERVVYHDHSRLKDLDEWRELGGEFPINGR